MFKTSLFMRSSKGLCKQAIMQLCCSKSVDEKIIGMKELISYISQGKTCDSLIHVVVKEVLFLDNNELKRLLYYFLELYTPYMSDSEMLLLNNQIRKDLESPNEYIRGIVLRYVSTLQKEHYLHNFYKSIQENMTHSVGYVRRNAYSCIGILARRFILQEVSDLLYDSLHKELDSLCLVQAFSSLWELNEKKAKVYAYEVNNKKDKDLSSTMIDRMDDNEFLKKFIDDKNPEIKIESCIKLLQSVQNVQEIMKYCVILFQNINENETYTLLILQEIIRIADKIDLSSYISEVLDLLNPYNHVLCKTILCFVFKTTKIEEAPDILNVVCTKLQEIAKMSASKRNVEIIVLEQIHSFICKYGIFTNELIQICKEYYLSDIPRLSDISLRILDEVMDKGQCEDKGVSKGQCEGKGVSKECTEGTEVSKGQCEGKEVSKGLTEGKGVSKECTEGNEEKSEGRSTEGVEGRITEENNTQGEHYTQGESNIQDGNITQEIVQFIVDNFMSLKYGKILRDTLSVLYKHITLSQYNRLFSIVNAHFTGYFVSVTTGSTTMNTTGNTIMNTTGSTIMNTTGSTTMNTTGSTIMNTTGSTIMNTTGGTIMNTTGSTIMNTTGSTTMNTTGSTIMNTTGSTIMNTTGGTTMNDNKSDKCSNMFIFKKENKHIIPYVCVYMTQMCNKFNSDTRYRLVALYLGITKCTILCDTSTRSTLLLCIQTLLQDKKQNEKIERQKVHKHVSACEPLVLSQLCCEQDEKIERLHRFLSTTCCADSMFNVVQMTGLSDPLYVEAVVKYSRFEIFLDLLVINQTNNYLQNVSYEFTTSRNIRPVHVNMPDTLTARAVISKNIVFRILDSSNGYINGTVTFKCPTTEGRQNVVINLSEIKTSVSDFLIHKTCTGIEFRTNWKNKEWENVYTIKLVSDIKLQNIFENFAKVVKGTVIDYRQSTDVFVGNVCCTTKQDNDIYFNICLSRSNGVIDLECRIRASKEDVVKSMSSVLNQVIRQLRIK